DLARDLPAFLHEDLAVADLSRDAAGAVDHETLPRRHLAAERAADLGHVDVDLAAEGALLRDLDRTAVHRRLDASLDDQRVAVVDFHALQLDVGTHDETAATGFLGLHGRHVGYWRRRRSARSGGD